MSPISQQESFVKESLFQFITKNVPSADLSVIDDIVLSYVISILEEASQDPCFDVEGFIEMMAGYVPEFANIDPGVVCSWVLELEAELSRHEEIDSLSNHGEGSTLTSLRKTASDEAKKFKPGPSNPQVDSTTPDDMNEDLELPESTPDDDEYQDLEVTDSSSDDGNEEKSKDQEGSSELPSKIKSRVSGAMKRRLIWWLEQGKSIEEATALAKKPFHELPDHPDIQAKIAHKRPGAQHNSIIPNKVAKLSTNEATGTVRVSIAAERPIKFEDYKLVLKEIGRAIDNCPEDLEPRFARSRARNGLMDVNCCDKATRDWLAACISDLKPWEGAQLRLCKKKIHYGFAYIPNDSISRQEVLLRLSKQNRELGCSNWRVVNTKIKEKGQTFTFSFDDDALSALRKSNYQAFFLTGIIYIHVKDPKRVPDKGSKSAPATKVTWDTNEPMAQPWSTSETVTTEAGRSGPAFAPSGAFKAGSSYSGMTESSDKRAEHISVWDTPIEAPSSMADDFLTVDERSSVAPDGAGRSARDPTPYQSYSQWNQTGPAYARIMRGIRSRPGFAKGGTNFRGGARGQPKGNARGFQPGSARGNSARGGTRGQQPRGGARGQPQRGARGQPQRGARGQPPRGGARGWPTRRPFYRPPFTNKYQ